MYENPVSYGILLIAMIISGIRFYLKYLAAPKEDPWFNTDFAEDQRWY